MRLILIILFMLVGTASSFSQKLTVLNQQNLSPLEDVQIISKGIVLFTNTEGEVDLGQFAPQDVLYIGKIGYHVTSISKKELGEKNYLLHMTAKSVELNEVVYSASRYEEKKSSTPAQITSVKREQIEATNPQNSGDMLAGTGEVFVQKSQMGGGSPVLRGFEANKVLIVVDGIRMNNAIYRGGHLQDVITLDASMLDRTEILFGPSSSMYGSDAMGGVMHFYTRNPMHTGSGFKVTANEYLRWASVNMEKTGHVDFNLGGKKLASLTSLTFSDFDDLQAGKSKDNFYDTLFERRNYVERIYGKDSMLMNPNRFLQKQSGYNQYDVMQKIKYSPSERADHTVCFQLSNSSKINRYDRLTEYNGTTLRFAEWYYGPQTRMMGYLKSRFRKEKGIYNSFTLTESYQHVKQERVSRRFNNATRRIQNETVSVVALNADLEKSLKKNHHLNYGLEGVYNDVQSKAHELNIYTEEKKSTDTRYPDGGSNMSALSFYLAHKKELSEKFFINEGVRYNVSMLNAAFKDTSIYPFPFDDINQQNQSLTGNVGFVALPLPSLKISLLGSTAYRTPNVDDIAKVFESAPGMLIVPNANLKPEQAYNVEFGIEKTFIRKIKVHATIWNTWLKQAIVTNAYSINGNDSVMYDGSMSKVMAAQNKNEGVIQGISGGIEIDFNTHFSFAATTTYTKGTYHDRIKDTIVSLDHIPPMFGQGTLSYKNKRTEAAVFVRYNAWKKLKDYSPSGEDNLQYATPNGMPEWYTLNCRISYTLIKQVRVQAGIDNILDTHYRVFASGISAPGRNITVCVRGSF